MCLIAVLAMIAVMTAANALITPDPYSPDEKNWVNVEMPQFKGSIHLTHKPVDGNLGEYLEDVHTMVTKHLIHNVARSCPFGVPVIGLGRHS